MGVVENLIDSARVNVTVLYVTRTGGPEAAQKKNNHPLFEKYSGGKRNALCFINDLLASRWSTISFHKLEFSRLQLFL